MGLLPTPAYAGGFKLGSMNNIRGNKLVRLAVIGILILIVAYLFYSIL